MGNRLILGKKKVSHCEVKKHPYNHYLFFLYPLTTHTHTVSCLTTHYNGMRFASAFYRGRCRTLIPPPPPPILSSSCRTKNSNPSIPPSSSFCRGPSPLNRHLAHTRASSTSPSTTTEEANPSPASQNNSPRYPDAANTTHHDLATYLAYAARTGLDTASSTYVGTAYEYVVAASLRRLGLDLRRVGGRDDCGIDLLGTWTLPMPVSPTTTTSSSGADAPLRILLQCKATGRSSRVGPHYIRELEGAFAGAPAGWRGRRNSDGSGSGSSGGGRGVLALLAAQKPATKGMREALGRSRWPMGYVSCTSDGHLEQLLWNRRAEEEGLAGLGVGVRYVAPSGGGGGGGQPEQELILTWRGNPYLPGADEPGPPEPDAARAETSPGFAAGSSA